MFLGERVHVGLRENLEMSLNTRSEGAHVSGVIKVLPRCSKHFATQAYGQRTRLINKSPKSAKGPETFLSHLANLAPQALSAWFDPPAASAMAMALSRP